MTLKNLNMTGIILAGGKAARMEGLDKALLKVGGETIIDRQLKTLRNIFTDIIIVTNTVESYKGIEGARLVPDIFTGRGPLGGIHAGLISSKTFHNFIVACDMPFLSEPLIRYMAEEARGHDCVVPEVSERLHPLFGVYSKNCIPVIEKLISRGDLRVSGIFPEVDSLVLSVQEIGKFDKQLVSLVNINTREDYEACSTVK